MNLPSTSQLAVWFLLSCTVKTTLAFGAGDYGSILLTPPVRHQAPLRLGFGNCLFDSPSSSYASASGLAFRDTRQHRPIAGPWPCRHEKLDSSEIARAGDQCRRGFAALRSDVQVDFAFLGSWHAVCGGEPAGRAGTVELDFRAIHAGSLRGMETNRSGDLRATRNRASRAGVRMR